MLRQLVTLALLVLRCSSTFHVPSRGHISSKTSDPEETMTVPQIIAYWGYPVETVSVTTEDGYILDMHRIPHGQNQVSPTPGQQRPVIFLQHGLEGCSSNWITNLPTEAAGYVFADAGFDVWMGNMRGTTYGKRHVSLSPHSHEFWDFSWDQMAKYDIPAMVDKVLQETGQSKLYYVGHSQGTLTMFSKLVIDQQFGPNKIHAFFALAPVGTVGHIRGLLHFIAEYVSTEIEFLLHLFGEDEFLPSHTFLDVAARVVCGMFHHENPLCDELIFLAAGPDSHQLNATRVPVYLGHCPAGTSTQNIIHWVQMVKSGRQQMYDYGNIFRNLEHYGQLHPPIYNIARVNAPTHLFWSDFDWLADAEDVQNHLIANIPPRYLVGNHQLTEFNHMDFVWGLRAKTEVYDPIISIVNHDFNG